MSDRPGGSGTGQDRQPHPSHARPGDSAAAGQQGERGNAAAPEDTMAGATAADESAARIAELEDLRLRAVADLDNMRKRCARQVTEAAADAQARATAQWLPVVDNLELALSHAQADPGSIVEGIRAVREQALSVLAQLGFPRRDDLGTMFDPARHEAIASRPAPDATAGSVIEVVRPGYGDGERQLRPAQVVVAKED